MLLTGLVGPQEEDQFVDQVVDQDQAAVDKRIHPVTLLHLKQQKPNTLHNRVLQETHILRG